MNNKELIEYLQQFPDNAIPSFIVANPKDRKYYEMENVMCITDMDVPVFCIEVGPAQDMDEEMVRVCKEDEAQTPILKELESKKKGFEECAAAEEVKLNKEWNKAVDECIKVVKNVD